MLRRSSSVLKNSLGSYTVMSQRSILHPSKAHKSLSFLSTAANENVPKYETLAVSVPAPFVYHVELNRPNKLNAMDGAMWREIRECFTSLASNSDCRVVILSGAGRMFTAGIDLKSAANIGSTVAEVDDIGRKAHILSDLIIQYQDSMSSLEKCPKPVITTVHSGCLGAGINLITAADIRFCTKDAWFQLKEVDIGMAADVGALQRLPKVIGSDSLARELAFAAKKIESAEAKACGLVSRVYDDKESMMKDTVEFAKEIAAKSPIAVQGTKLNMIYSRDHTVQEGLDHIRFRNMIMLQSEDFTNAVMAQATKSPPPTFSKL